MKLLIPEAIRHQIIRYVEETAPYEVTGIGTITVDQKAESFQVSEIFLPQQKVSLSHCSFTPNALHKIIFDIVKDNPARAGDLRFRWHSHGEGKVFWSTIDEADIDNTDSDWTVNLVVNRQHDMLARLDLFQPFRLRNLPLTVINLEEIDSQIIAQCHAEAAEKIHYVPLTAKKESAKQKEGNYEHCSRSF